MSTIRIRVSSTENGAPQQMPGFMAAITGKTEPGTSITDEVEMEVEGEYDITVPNTIEQLGMTAASSFAAAFQSEAIVELAEGVALGDFLGEESIATTIEEETDRLIAAGYSGKQARSIIVAETMRKANESKLIVPVKAEAQPSQGGTTDDDDDHSPEAERYADFPLVRTDEPLVPGAAYLVWFSDTQFDEPQTYIFDGKELLHPDHVDGKVAATRHLPTRENITAIRLLAVVGVGSVRIRSEAF